MKKLISAVAVLSMAAVTEGQQSNRREPSITVEAGVSEFVPEHSCQTYLNAMRRYPSNLNDHDSKELYRLVVGFWALGYLMGGAFMADFPLEAISPDTAATLVADYCTASKNKDKETLEVAAASVLVKKVKQ